MGNAGRVLMIPKGDYNAATTYEMLDFVYYQGRSYVCKQTSTGNVPTNTTYWQALTGDASAEIQALTNQLTDEVSTRAKLGAHNLIPFPYAESSGKSRGSVTFTYDAEGIITISGTKSGNAYIFLMKMDESSDLVALAKDTNCKVIISKSLASTRLDIEWYDSTQTFISTSQFSQGGNVVCPNNAAYCQLVVTNSSDNGTVISDTVRAMIVLATDTDPTYQPYAKTNVELTQELAVNSVDVSAIATGASMDTNKSKANGDSVSLVLKAVLPQVDYEGEYLLRAASNGRPKAESAWGFGVRITDNTAHRFYENTDGYICNTAAITAGTYYIFLNYFK